VWPSRIAGIAARALLVASACLPGARARAGDDAVPLFAGYREPAPEVVELLTAPREPEPLLHEASARIALRHRETLLERERLARPWYGLAGFRFDPRSGTSGAEPLVHRVEVFSLREPERAPAVWEPAGGALLADVRFSPDGERLSAVAIGDGPARLALFEIETAREERLSAPIQAAWGEPCDWVATGALLCRLQLGSRGAPPAPRIEPDVLEHDGGAQPLPTYSNLLDDEHEETLFEYYFSSELARVEIDGRVARVPGTRGLLSHAKPSPDGELVVLTRIERPYSRLAPARRFPSRVEIWDLGAAKRLYGSGAAGLGADPEPESSAPRHFLWRPGEPTTLGWLAEIAEEDGAPSGERWMALTAPFERAVPYEIARSDEHVEDFDWTTAGTPLFETSAGDTSTVYAVGPDGPRAISKGVSDDPTHDPGGALRTAGGRGPVLESGGRIFLAGDGPSAGAPRPFLDALHLETGERERLFTSDPSVFESVVGIVDADASWLVTSRESERDPPNLFSVQGASRRPIRPFPSPYPALDAAERRSIRYHRSDGVELRGTLYLPADWKSRAPLPTLLWIYPREYADREYAEQVDVRLFRYHRVRSASPLAAVLAGYAVLVNPMMPIIGEGDALNDAYLEQLVENARAAVDHLVTEGISDPQRVAISGHSYGAFSAANLLVHSRLFATGISISGAYNRTLTPFGFQHEKRSLWNATDFYARVSPFFSADRIEAPLLLVHGGADSNPGTPPLQARRFFHALVGVGARARYVEMPLEDHHLRARGSVLHVAAEMIDWLDRTIGPDAAPRTADSRDPSSGPGAAD
jgi:dipeptidyl aminopeptidase/acylaminoacyl peptidase